MNGEHIRYEGLLSPAHRLRRRGWEFHPMNPARAPYSRRTAIALVAALTGAAAGIALSLRPVETGILAVALLLGSLIAVMPTPVYRRFVGASVTFVLLAETQFRVRDRRLALIGNFDAQILFELSMYFLLAVIVIRGLPLAYSRARRLRPAEVLLFLHASIALLSTAWSPFPSLTAVRALEWLILVLTASVVIRLLGPTEAAKQCFYWSTAYVITCSTMALAFPWAALWFGDGPSARFSWFKMHPVGAGRICAMAGLLVVVQVLASFRGWRSRNHNLLRIILLIALMSVLLMTRSRGPPIAFFVSTLAVTLWCMGRARLFPIAVAAIGVGLPLFLSFNFSEALGDVVTSKNPAVVYLRRDQDSRGLLTFTGRTELWKDVMPIALQKPLLGFGYQASRGEVWKASGWATSSHNGIIDSLLDLGVLGTTLLLLSWSRCLFVRPTPQPRFSGNAAGALSFGVGVQLAVMSITDAGLAAQPGFVPAMFAIAAVASDTHRFSLLSSQQRAVGARSQRDPLPIA